ncbi:bifunctional folylpolyglutamate synthase/dihydrofolate synthase [Atopobium fossor]|uniref:bifunctional folylpolyglutamate synthase/dihydrofolate synthase n=1 Tax=Atopobium fossor TaxID=39487 RepID=UPI00041419D3|nr:Mur ligase family protein [Atopobium fossor]
MSYSLPFAVTDFTYDQALTYLHAALRFGIEPLLETVQDMLVELNNPDLAFKSLQIAGTNGKTSTARFAAALLRGERYKTALYTSPELVYYTERMEIDGKPVSPEDFGHGVAAAAEAGRRVNERRRAEGLRPYDITEFDTLTVAACVLFAEKGVEVAVLECGMGGRWDATSAVKSICSVAITGVGLDHTRILGDTLEAIAQEKAAIIKPGRTCVLGVGTATPALVEDVFLQRCLHAGVTPTLLRPAKREDAEGQMHCGELRVHPEFPLATYDITHYPNKIGDTVLVQLTTPYASYGSLGALKPSYQAANFSCATVLVEQFLDCALDELTAERSIVQCPTPGRFDLVRSYPPELVDACHNPQSVQTFLTAVRAIAPKKEDRPQLLCAVLADKDVKGIVKLLAAEFFQVCVTQTQSPRALPASELAQLFEQVGCTPMQVFSTVGEAVKALEGTPWVACGSITLAGEVVGILR